MMTPPDVILALMTGITGLVGAVTALVKGFIDARIAHNRLASIEEASRGMAREMAPDHGASMKDSSVRTEDKIDALGAAMHDIGARIHSIDKAISGMRDDDRQTRADITQIRADLSDVRTTADREHTLLRAGIDQLKERRIP